MLFIGIVTKKKNEDLLNKKIKNVLKKLNINSVIVNINKKTIDNIRNIKFDIIILDSNLEDKELIKNILKETYTIFLNVDIKIDLEIISNLKKTLITYGFNPKATLTVSSVGEENTILCLQRNIKNSKGNIINIQEIKIDRKLDNSEVYNIMIETILEFFY